MDIRRLLPNDQYQAAINANAPTGANPFATIADLGGTSDLATTLGFGNTTSGNNIVLSTADYISITNTNHGTFLRTPDALVSWALTLGAFAMVNNIVGGAVSFGANGTGGQVIFNAASLIYLGGSTQITGLGTTSATTILKVTNSAVTELFRIYDDGKVTVNSPVASTAKFHIKGANASVAFRVDADNRNNAFVVAETAGNTSAYICMNTATQFSNALLTVQGNVNIANSLSFGTQAFVGNAVSMPTGYVIQIGGTTRIGEDAGTTYVDAGADHIIQFRNSANQVNAYFDNNGVAGNTRFVIYDVDNGTLERVSVGVADSGGVGFKVLRIPN